MWVLSPYMGMGEVPNLTGSVPGTNPYGLVLV